MANETIELYNAAELQSKALRPLLDEIVVFLNAVYCRHPDFATHIRFHDNEQFLSALGENGTCAVVYEERNPNIVATASIRPYGHLEKSPHALVGEATAATSENEYEVCCVGTGTTSKGLAARSMDAVIAALPCFNGPDTAATATLWVKSANHNRTYWERRGYSVVKSQDVKAGFWGCSRDFTIWTLKQEIRNPNECG